MRIDREEIDPVIVTVGLILFALTIVTLQNL